jgi:hypothetical protein
MITPHETLIERIARFQRAQLAEIEYAIETRVDDLRTLLERREAAVKALEETERSRERDNIQSEGSRLF